MSKKLNEADTQSRKQQCMTIFKDTLSNNCKMYAPPPPRQELYSKVYRIYSKQEKNNIRRVVNGSFYFELASKVCI